MDSQEKTIAFHSLSRRTPWIYMPSVHIPIIFYLGLLTTDLFLPLGSQSQASKEGYIIGFNVLVSLRSTCMWVLIFRPV